MSYYAFLLFGDRYHSCYSHRYLTVHSIILVYILRTAMFTEVAAFLISYQKYFPHISTPIQFLLRRGYIFSFCRHYNKTLTFLQIKSTPRKQHCHYWECPICLPTVSQRTLFSLLIRQSKTINLYSFQFIDPNIFQKPITTSFIFNFLIDIIFSCPIIDVVLQGNRHCPTL